MFQDMKDGYVLTQQPRLFVTDDVIVYFPTEHLLFLSFLLFRKTKNTLFHIHRKNAANRGAPRAERLQTDRFQFLLYRMAYHPLSIIRDLSQYLLLPVDYADQTVGFNESRGQAVKRFLQRKVAGHIMVVSVKITVKYYLYLFYKLRFVK